MSATWLQAEELESYPGYSGQYPNFTLILDERFDQLDPGIWSTGDGAVGSESICRFTEQGVRVVNGILELSIVEEPVPASFSNDHQHDKPAFDYSCGELRSNQQFHYGRIEARMRAPAREVASGYITSLFTYSHDATRQPKEWEEIDIELEGGRPDKFQANLIYGINAHEWLHTRQYGAWEDKIEIGPVDQWRVFALEWLPSEINWYVDGELVKSLTQQDIDCDPACVGPQRFPARIPDNPTTLMINFWIPNDAIEDYFGGNKHRNVYPMKSQYDWIRVYAKETNRD